MRVFVINGSPKGSKSNTLRLTDAFLSGLGDAEVRTVTLRDTDLKPCLGALPAGTELPANAAWMMICPVCFKICSGPT